VGISREASILDLACELDIIQKSGSWFSYNNERIGQGRENTRLFLKDNTDLCNEIEQKIRESMKDVELFKLGENDAVDLGEDGDEASIQEDA
jgi:recombination protein RecA